MSPLTGTQSTKEKSKQNITRDIEVKNNLTLLQVLICKMGLIIHIMGAINGKWGN